MPVVSPERAKHGYLLDKDEGEAYWLLGMLEIVKISGADTNGDYGLVEITVRAGEGSPWHVHPDEDEWFYVLDGEFTVYVGDTRMSLPAAHSRSAPRACRTPSSRRRTGRGR
jgi:quercetin dioxygenase-like cupin family protein